MKKNNKFKIIFFVIISILTAILIAGIAIGATGIVDFRDSSKFITNTDKSTWEVGEYLGVMAVHSGGGTPTDLHGNLYAQGFQFAERNDFFCIDLGQTYHSGGKRIKLSTKSNLNNARSERVPPQPGQYKRKLDFIKHSEISPFLKTV